MSKKKIIKKKINYNDKKVENYVINMDRVYNNGLGNFLNLVVYQLILLYLLFKIRKKINIIHCFDLDTGLPVKVFSKTFGVNYLYHIADFYVDSRMGIPSYIRKVIKNKEHCVINNAEVTIVCTEERKKQIKGAIPKKTIVVHNTPKVEKKVMFPVKPEVKNQKQIEICYIGSLSKTRFIDELINIAIKNDMINLKLGGFGDLTDFLIGLDYSNIEFLGEVDYSDTFYHYSKCDLMVAMYDPKVPNHRYSAPNKVYEAMYLGKPIIVAKDTGLDGLICDNNIGYSIEYSGKAFEQLINNILKNKHTLEVKGDNAKRLYSSYSWDLMKSRIEDTYKEIEKDT